MENLNYVCTITEPRLLKTGVDQDTIHFVITTVSGGFLFPQQKSRNYKQKNSKNKRASS
jgi:hypothetical protein